MKHRDRRDDEVRCSTCRLFELWPDSPGQGGHCWHSKRGLLWDENYARTNPEIKVEVGTFIPSIAVGWNTRPCMRDESGGPWTHDK